MFGISAEHLLILGVVLLIFGPKRLPEMGNTLGKAIKNFKDSVSGVEEAAFRKRDEANEVEEKPKASEPEKIAKASAEKTETLASAPKAAQAQPEKSPSA